MEFCQPGFQVSPELLKAIFGLPEIPTGANLEMYRQRYKDDCEGLTREYLRTSFEKEEPPSNIPEPIELTSFSVIDRCLENHSAFVRTKFVWRGSSDNRFKAFVERFMNSAYFGITNGCLTWSQWLLLTDDGQNLLSKLAQGSGMERIYALATLQVYLIQIYITSGYDSNFFRREFFRILPAIQISLFGYSLLNKILELGISYGVGKVLFRLIKSIMKRYYSVPDEFFTDFAVISKDETIYIGNTDEEKEN
jgi:hypothetical protein